MSERHDVSVKTSNGKKKTLFTIKKPGAFRKAAKRNGFVDDDGKPQTLRFAGYVLSHKDKFNDVTIRRAASARGLSKMSKN